jgi:hypothetical protein
VKDPEIRESVKLIIPKLDVRQRASHVSE